MVRGMNVIEPYQYGSITSLFNKIDLYITSHTVIVDRCTGIAIRELCGIRDGIDHLAFACNYKAVIESMCISWLLHLYFAYYNYVLYIYLIWVYILYHYIWVRIINILLLMRTNWFEVTGVEWGGGGGGKYAMREGEGLIWCAEGG